MPYRKLGPPLTVAQFRRQERAKANRKRPTRAESRMRKYYERKRKQAVLVLLFLFVVGVLAGVVWLAYSGHLVLTL